MVIGHFILTVKTDMGSGIERLFFKIIVGTLHQRLHEDEHRNTKHHAHCGNNGLLLPRKKVGKRYLGIYTYFHIVYFGKLGVLPVVPAFFSFIITSLVAKPFSTSIHSSETMPVVMVTESILSPFCINTLLPFTT